MADDTIRIKNLPNVKPEPERGEVLVTDGSETNGLESDYLCNLEDNFGGRFREDVQYEVNDTCMYHGKRWKFIREHEGPFDTDDVVWARMSSLYEIWVAEYGVTAAYFMAVAVQEGDFLELKNVPVPGIQSDEFITCYFTSVKDDVICFVGFYGDQVVEAKCDYSGDENQWSVTTSPKTQIFQAVYGTTTWAEILAAADSGARWVRLAYSEGVSEGDKSVVAYASINTVGGTEACFSAAVGEDIWNFYINKTTNAWRYEKTGVIPKVQSATAGKFAKIKADGTIEQSGLGESDLEKLDISDASIYEFATPSGYDAHTKSTSVSEVSFVATPKIVHFDGVNVERNSNPSVGDALYIDASGGKHFIDGKTYVPSSIPSGFTSVGAVVARKGDKALILHKDENTGVKFASCWQHEITGLANHLGTEITIQFRQALTSGNINIGSPLVFTPATLAEAAAAIDTHLRANPGGTAAGAGWNYNWHCELALNYAGEESVIVTSDNIVDYRQANAIVDTSASTSGITGTMNMCNFLPAYGDSTMLRVNGGFGYRPGWNFERLKQWATTNTTIATPSSMVSVHDGFNIVSQDQFENNQYCADLRAEYGTFDNYIKSLMLRWPVRKGGQWSLYGTGKGNTEQLASKTHLNLAGDTVDTFSAAKWSASKSFDSDGLRLGDWYMPQMDECFDIFAPMKLDGSDPVNATLKKMTGNARSLSVSRWVPARNYNNSAWIMNSNGPFYNSSFLNANRCEAVALLTINP